MKFTPEEEQIVSRKVWFDRFMIGTRLLTLVGVIAIAVAGQFYYADLAQKQSNTDQRVIELIEKLTYDREQSQIRNEESHGEMTAFIKCIALIVSAKGEAQITNGELQSCEVSAQAGVDKKPLTPNPQPSTRSEGSPGATGPQDPQGPPAPSNPGLIPDNFPLLGGL